MAIYRSRHKGEKIDEAVDRALPSGSIDLALQNINQSLQNKQNTLSFDGTPTKDSSNPVTSGGVFNSVSGKEFKAVYSLYNMLSANWQNNEYSFESIYPSSDYNLEVSMSEETTIEEVQAFSEAVIVGNSQSNVLKALGTVPTIDIKVILKVVRK